MAEQHQTENDPGRGLSHHGLEALLDRLAPDREQAAERYRMIHRRLTHLYEWRGCPSPEELADEVLDRVASKLEAGVEIHSPERYVARVASLVFREIVRREQRRRAALDEERRAHPPAHDGEEEEEEDGVRWRCFQLCMNRLGPEERSRLLRYYEGDKGTKIANRRRLAEELEVAAGTLRIRMLRLRTRLEKCIHGCVAHSGKVTDHTPESL